MGSAELLQFAVAGLKNGSIYALVALGFTLVFGSTGIINFAQGEFFMLGGMLAVFFVKLGLPLPLAVVAGVLATAVVGLAFERVALRPRRDSGPLALIIITIGGSMVLRSLSRHAFGGNELSLPAFTEGASIVVAGAAIERQALWVWGLTIVAVAGLSWLYSKTRFGRSMRACSLSHEASRLMGIDTARIVMVSFGLAAVLGALAG
ncbi:MAG: branched-chain amino acid ABC transporter permease, partial [Coriobacteriia bacterium]|nr:branched-chain amino acid ABC transporter permease [Coriobacteriia bacterium]